jgi:Tfp pilus assembly protein PilF
MKIRECDLMVGSGDLENAKLCWEKGLSTFPNNPDMLNELGSVLVQLGELSKAADAYEEAMNQGMVVLSIV